MPLFAPWIALALLFLPRQNRARQALWVLLPLGFFLISAGSLLALMSIMGSAQVAVFMHVVMGTAFAQAAIMLLSPWLKGRNRFVTFLGLALIAGVFGVGFVALQQDWKSPDSSVTAAMISSSVLCLIIVFALTLSGFCCRRHYSCLRFSAWTVLWTVFAFIVTIIIACVMDSPPSILQVIMVLLVLSAMTLGMILPFLIVSFASPFFRTRLIDLFSMQTPLPPVAPGAAVVAPTSPVVPASPAPPATPAAPAESSGQQPQP